jgi:hypothetical protein
MLVVVADEWKTSVSSGLGEPRIALRQSKELIIVRDGPPQPQTGERPFHCMDNGHRAAVVSSKSRSVGDKDEGPLYGCHFSTNP